MKILGEKFSLCKLVISCILFCSISSAQGITPPLETIHTFQPDFISGNCLPQGHTASLLNTSRDTLQDTNEVTHCFQNNYIHSSLSWINVTPLSQTVSENSFFTIKISVVPGEFIAGVQMELIFNPNLILVDSILEGDLFQEYSNYFNPGIIDNINGSIKNVFNVILSPHNGVSTPGTFATIRLKSKNSNGISSLNLSNIMLGNPSALPVPTRVTNGSVIVSAQDSCNPEISNISIYHTKGNNIVNITCTATDNQGIKTVNASIITPSNTRIHYSMTRYGKTDIYYLNLSYPNCGAYYFSVIAEDLSGSTQQSHVRTIYRFCLSQGWNLITIPLQSNYTASSLSREIGKTCDSIVEWNPLTQAYSSHPAGTFIDDFPILPQQGFFIHVWNNTHFILSGHLLQSQTLSLTKGYNLIGWYTQSTITAGSLLDSITGCDSVSTWNPLTGAYRTYLDNNSSNPFTITSGDGVFIHLQQDTTWQQGQ